MNTPPRCLWAARALALVICPLAAGEITLPAVIGDHMVLQRDTPAPIWGRGEPGEKVVVQFGLQTHATFADEGGNWSITLAPMDASSTPRTLVIEGSERIELADVLVGEVWICGGQSNMEWTIDRSEDPARERADANRPTLRLIKAPHVTAGAPAFTIDAAWQLCTPETVGSFSAIGFTFGRDLQDALDVPVGLLSINWGGTRIEPWISRASLEAHPRSRDRMLALGRQQDEYANMSAEEHAEKRAEMLVAHARSTTSYLDRQLVNDPGTSGKWFAPTVEPEGWKPTELPRTFKDVDRNLAPFDGGVWFRKTLNIPAAWTGKDLSLELGAIDDSDIVWFNGVRIGSLAEAWNTLRTYRINAALVRPGSSTITVLAIDSGGIGGFAGPAKAMRLDLEEPPAGEQNWIPLAGTWQWRQGAAHSGGRPPAAPVAVEPSLGARDYAAMHNGMISAFAPYAVRGAIWYQGESNANEPEAYRDFLPLLIRDWADTFQREAFPFGVVQLAAFRPFVKNKPAQGAWALLRDAQSHAARTMEDVGLIVTTDIGDANDIHPRRKREVGRRLSLWALSEVYDRDIDAFSGPVFESAVPTALDDGTKAITITFVHANGGLATRGDDPLGGFAIAGADGVFHWAVALISGKDKVTLSSPDVAEPTRVRYAWQNNPEPANLVNGFGLPADGFQFD